MKNVFFISILFAFFVSCGEPKKEYIDKPEVFLEKKEFIDVIVDLQILESHYHNEYQVPEIYANALDSASYYVFKKHKIDKNIFQENFNYYSFEKDSIFNIYEIVLDTINNRLNIHVD